MFRDENILLFITVNNVQESKHIEHLQKQDRPPRAFSRVQILSQN